MVKSKKSVKTADVKTSDTNFTTTKNKSTPKTKSNVQVSKIKRRILRHTTLLRVGLIVGFLAVVSLFAFVAFNHFKKSQAGFYLRLAKNFVSAPSSKIKSFEGKTNILVLGKGGLGHEAPDLTDTMMFVSIDLVNPKINLISLPRDIWITDLRAKLNSAYYWGNKKMPGGGIILAKSTVEEIVGQPIHYAVVLDFSGFVKIIDVVGGVDVDVVHPFVDEKYPIAGKENDLCDGDPEFKCRYETISFEKGVTHMDGATALKFVRSRNAQGDEGTDLARAARQQLVLKALEDKMLSRDVYLSFSKMTQIFNVVQSSTETDLDPDAISVLARYAYNARNTVESNVLSEDLLLNPPETQKYDNLYVFIPKSGNWDETHAWVKCLLDEVCE